MDTPPVFPKSFGCYKPSNHKVYGTVCISPDNTVLVVKGRRSGKWSFPKGHKLRAETYINCALRETLEETGVSLHNREHRYYQKMSAGEYYFFDVDAELQTSVGDSLEIEEAAWLSPRELESLSCNVDVNYWLSRRNRPIRPTRPY